MPVKVIVNPSDTTGNNQAILEDDEQVILEVEIIYSDGYKKTLKAFIHGGLVAPNNCDKMVHLNMTEPVMVG